MTLCLRLRLAEERREPAGPALPRGGPSLAAPAVLPELFLLPGWEEALRCVSVGLDSAFSNSGPLSGVCVLPFVRGSALVFFVVIWSVELGAIPLGNGGLRVMFQTCALR